MPGGRDSLVVTTNRFDTAIGRSYPPAMVRETRASTTADPSDPQDSTGPEGPTAGATFLGIRVSEPDLTTLPIAGITRRRMAALVGVLLAAWIVIVFARQVSEASAATGRAESMVEANAVRGDEIARMERELEQIQRQPYVLQQARAFGLGGPREIPFTLAADAPSLAPDAPGSAAVRLGATGSISPLERWLTILFGPAD